MSFIIPVYNAEKYLPACLDSVVNQTQREIEIIIIDDGSTDNSSAIIKQYAEQDSRIVVISRPNSGVSSARNTGIDIARGIYTWFIDADDWIEINAVELLKKVAEGNRYDVVLFSWAGASSDGSILRNIARTFKDQYRFNPHSRDEILSNIINGRLCTIWRGIYLADLIKNQQIFFDETMRNSEDELYICNILIKSQAGIFVDYCLYYHRQTPYSLTHTFHQDEFTNSLRARTLAWREIDSLLPDNRFADKFVVRNTISSINYIVRLFQRHDKAYPQKRLAALENILHNRYFQAIAWKVRYTELGLLYKVELWLARRKMAHTIWALNSILFSRAATKVINLMKAGKIKQ